MENRFLKLMIPGPIQPADDVLEAMGGPVQAHYGPAWTKTYNETLDLLRPVFDTHGDVFLLVGSGTSGIDACLGSSLCSGDKILIGDNGFFGDRLGWIAEGYGLEVIPVPAEWGKPLRAADFENALRRHPDAKAAAFVHLETSTTIVNPVEEIAHICRKYGALCIVDAVSSLGGLPFHMDEWGVDLCASATQKCLGAPPGLSPVAVSQRAWDAIDREPNKGHGWYLNLRVWRDYADKWGDWHPFPITMATNNVLALRVSLKALLAEGIDSRLARYRELALHLREGLRAVGLPPYTPDEMLAPVLTAACMPEGMTSGPLVQFMAEERGIKISGGLGALKEKIIRIGHMSPTVTTADIDEVLEGLRAFEAIKVKS